MNKTIFKKRIKNILKDYDVYIDIKECENCISFEVYDKYDQLLLDMIIRKSEKEEFLKILEEIEKRFDFSFILGENLEDLKKFLEATKTFS